ncbi:MULTISPECIES: TadE family type IV pilus minor pilin [unclassified Microbacterium]|uniref:TadE family type IV pilus minor pilin n=1 Tax=unclassified Microbacterium TaxID=2609290 RepID=UPI00365D0746
MTTHRAERGRRPPDGDARLPRTTGRDRAFPGAGGHDRQRGSATAELAVALPIVVLVMLLGAGVVGAGTRLVSLQDAAADAARILGRGDADGDADAVVRRADPAAGIAVSRSDGLVCVTAGVDTRILGSISIPMRATGCALDGGR